jgi:hypothetical protein
MDRVLFSTAKQDDTLKKRTMDKTLENTLKVSINTTLPTLARLVMTKESSPMMMTHTGNTSSLVHEIIMIIINHLKTLDYQGVDNQDQISV